MKNDKIQYQLFEKGECKRAIVSLEAGNATDKYISFYSILHEGNESTLTILILFIVNFNDISSHIILHVKLNELSTRRVITKKDSNMKTHLVKDFKNNILILYILLLFPNPH